MSTEKTKINTVIDALDFEKDQFTSADERTSTIETIKTQFSGDPKLTIKMETVSETETLSNKQATRFYLSGKNDSSGPEAQFDFIENIGRGGMGEVDAVVQHSLNREVAIKRLHTNSFSSCLAKSLHNEAMLMGKLDHPNITPIYLMGYDSNGLPVVVMKRIRGVALSSMLENKAHPHWNLIKGNRIKWKLRTFIQICNAVEYAHSKEILHLDIKASNIMIGSFGEVFLIDWGIAEEIKEGSLHRNTFSGTPSHAAPEMYLPQHALTKRTDIYLLGATLYEILTGKTLHNGSNIIELMDQSLKGSPISASDIHPELIEINNKATNKIALQRFDSVTSLRNAIEAHIERRDALDLLISAENLLRLFREEALKRKANERKLYQLLFQCRFAFEEALRKSPDLEQAQFGLWKAMEIIAEYEINKGQLNSANRILKELEEQNCDPLIIENLRTRILKAVSKKEKTDELNTQIQYKLMEQILNATNKDKP